MDVFKIIPLYLIISAFIGMALSIASFAYFSSLFNFVIYPTANIMTHYPQLIHLLQ